MKQKILIGAIILAVVIAAALAWKARGNGNGETIIAEKQDLVRRVELSGKVIPEEEVDLAFEVGGTVAGASKKVGDKINAGEVIAYLDQTKVYADLAKSEADLAAAKGELTKLQGGGDFSPGIASSKTSLVQDILDAYTDADDAIHNKVDQFFVDGTSAGPKILNSFDDNKNVTKSINDGRLYIEEILTAWKKRIEDLSASNFTQGDLATAKTNLDTIASFLDLVSYAVNNFQTNHDLTQTTIDKYRTDFASARQSVNSARASLIAGEKAFSSDLSDVPVESAKVRAAEATVANYRATLSKMTLRSPIAGIVSRQDAKKGEAVSANQTVASVISSGYEVEAFVPEVSFAGMALGNKARITLDAYGDEVAFNGVVVHIDPRETIRDGVSTYKIDIRFSTPDERIRSGMTANLDIETSKKSSALAIPMRSVLDKNGKKTVLVKVNGKGEEREVKTGISDSEGNVEVLSGLTEGEEVYIDPVKK